MSATFTVNVQLALRASASVASHVTVVFPTEKRAPGAGSQLTMTGGWPCSAKGISKFTGGRPATRASADRSAGQLIAGGLGTGGGAGATGVAARRLPQSTASAVAMTMAARRIIGEEAA